MFAIEQLSFGYQVGFAGRISETEMTEWLTQMQVSLVGAPRSFGLLLDLRALVALESESQDIFARGLGLLQANGLQRSAVVVVDALTRSEFTRSARESGAYHWERYFSIEETPDWLPRANAWLSMGLDPDLCIALF